jgi:hypothetical protein
MTASKTVQTVHYDSKGRVVRKNVVSNRSGRPVSMALCVVFGVASLVTALAYVLGHAF